MRLIQLLFDDELIRHPERLPGADEQPVQWAFVIGGIVLLLLPVFVAILCLAAHYSPSALRFLPR